ncbi:uncharacterized protein LOC101862519 [Aplysia californica]|uniref:Uncharacterized protein LOC101862519 n=1 Tax=Aplysia californica TaxID=6500 RepID=A0ABM0JXE7_APLCA|nr:uncharacterized protein LOC101862519 [Aplysia californica]
MMWRFGVVLLTFLVQAVPILSLCLFQHLFPTAKHQATLTNSDYPEFSWGVQCFIWSYTGAPGTRVRISFMDVDIPLGSGNCEEASLMFGPVGDRKYCGDSLVKDFPSVYVTLTSSQQRVYVLFNSTSEHSRSRFRLRLDIDPAGDGVERTSPEPPTANMPQTSPYYTQADSSSRFGTNSCHSLLTSTTGEVRSSRVLTSLLLSRGQCSWLLRTPHSPGTVVHYRLNFQYCHLYRNDKLSVYKGEEPTGHPFATYDGYGQCPFFSVIKAESVLITYKPDERWVRTMGPANFTISYVASGPDTDDNLMSTPEPVITWTTVREETGQDHRKTCNFLITASMGVVNTSTDLTFPLLASGQCSWLLHTPHSPGTVIYYRLTFNNCHLYRNDQLRVYKGKAQTGFPMATYGNGQCPYHLTVESENVLITYQPHNLGSSAELANFSISFVRETTVNCLPGHLPCGQGERRCYRREKSCDGVWDCPVRGGDEKGCSRCPQHEYSCNLTLTYCYREEDRCNGKEKCSNYMDEMNCTPQQCSKEKGLFLCKNKRCVFEKWRCDHTRDCQDGSDEENCSSVPSTRVIVAAVVGATMCALLLVIVLGCICKIFSARMHQLEAVAHTETPLTRLQAELFRRRAPPPPYNEAMVTSRPYHQACQELLAQGQMGAEGHEATAQTQDRGDQRRGRRHRNRRCSGRHRRTGGQSAGVSGELTHQGEVSPHSGQHPSAAGEAGDLNVPPPYSVLDPCANNPWPYLDCSSSTSEEDWPEEDSVRHRGDDDDDVPLLDLGAGDGSSVDMEMTSAAVGGGVSNPSLSFHDTLSRSAPALADTHGEAIRPLCTLLELEEEEEKEEDTASRSLSMDWEPSSPPPHHCADKLDATATVISEDSDSECILGADHEGDRDAAVAHEEEDEDEEEEDDGDAGVGVDTDSDTAVLIP